MKLRAALAAPTGVASAAMLAACTGGSGSAHHRPTAPAELTKALAAIEHAAPYRQSDWGYAVIDQGSGNALESQNAEKMFDPGSTMKIYSVTTALKAYGPNHRFHTPVYREGTVTGGALHGNLVLVASGDLSLGLREQPDGALFYENSPQLDQSYADTGLPGAVEPPGNPLAGRPARAAVRASGITKVDGNVVIDDRLFTSYTGFPDGPISAIWVNENLIDILAKPTAVGHPASIGWRPMTASYTVTNHVTTVRAGKATSLAINEPASGKLVVTGQIAADSTPTLVVQQVDNPSAFAWTALIEALQRAGVSVAAKSTGPNPDALLPVKGSYRPTDKIGEHVSATLAEFANLILKVSYNRGADLMTCLTAVKAGSTDCEQGLVNEVDTAHSLGVTSTSLYPLDGAGSDDQGRTTPTSLATFLRRALSTSFGSALYNGLPVLGRSGTLANVLPRSSVAGTPRSRPATASPAPPRTSYCCSATASPDTSRPSPDDT